MLTVEFAARHRCGGRRAALTWFMLLVAIPTALVGALHTYQQA
jgi:hypothetical protein